MNKDVQLNLEKNISTMISVQVQHQTPLSAAWWRERGCASGLRAVLVTSGGGVVIPAGSSLQVESCMVGEPHVIFSTA